MPRFGLPLRLPPPSRESQLIVDPTGGINTADAPTDIQPSQSPSCENVIFRYNSMQPRPLLVAKSSNNRPGTVGSPILGGAEVTDVNGNAYPLVSMRTQLAWYSTGSWSLLSYVSSYGLNAAPAAGPTDYWDIIDTYYDQRDENIAILANNSYQTLYCWQSGTTVFSSLTGAPMARCVESFNNYVLAANVKSGGSHYVQRVQWSDRGSASSWTGGLAGFEDLLAMHGQITRVVGQENRVVILSDREVWQGLPVDYPFLFSFQPLDRNMGCPYPWTVAITPLGIIFLGYDLQVYMLPKTGGPAQPIGHKVFRLLRDNIDTPERSWAVYDSTYNQYQLYYPVQGGAGYPEKAVFLNVGTAPGAEVGAWAPQSFPLTCTRGFDAAEASSSGTTWGGAGTLTWAQAASQWNQIGGTSHTRNVIVGESSGFINHFVSNSTYPGVVAASRWRSLAYTGFEPTREKTLTEIRIDYQADSASSLTLRTSSDQGGTFDAGQRLNLPATSQESQVRAFVYASSRYPCFEVTSEHQNFRLFRFWANMRVTGR